MDRLRDRVVGLMQTRPGESLCVGCIAKALGATHKSAHEATLKLEARPGFTRGYGPCVLCGKTRIVTQQRASPTSAAGGADGV